MHPKIKEQKELMQKALRHLDNINTAGWLLSYDPPMQKVAIDHQQNEYAETMRALLELMIHEAAKQPA
jgi:hypothetical protein